MSDQQLTFGVGQILPSTTRQGRNGTTQMLSPFSNNAAGGIKFFNASHMFAVVSRSKESEGLYRRSLGLVVHLYLKGKGFFFS